MSNYRLTEKQERNLNLIPVTWELVRRTGASQVYIRAHTDSPTYGPYKVVDASREMISKLDGTEPRHYPRDKGLFISQAMPLYGIQNPSKAYTLIKEIVKNLHVQIGILEELAEILK